MWFIVAACILACACEASVYGNRQDGHQVGYNYALSTAQKNELRQYAGCGNGLSLGDTHTYPDGTTDCAADEAKRVDECAKACYGKQIDSRLILGFNVRPSNGRCYCSLTQNNAAGPNFVDGWYVGYDFSSSCGAPTSMCPRGTSVFKNTCVIDAPNSHTLTENDFTGDDTWAVCKPGYFENLMNRASPEDGGMDLCTGDCDGNECQGSGGTCVQDSAVEIRGCRYDSAAETLMNSDRTDDWCSPVGSAPGQISCSACPAGHYCTNPSRPGVPGGSYYATSGLDSSCSVDFVYISVTYVTTDNIESPLSAPQRKLFNYDALPYHDPLFQKPQWTDVNPLPSDFSHFNFYRLNTQGVSQTLLDDWQTLHETVDSSKWVFEDDGNGIVVTRCHITDATYDLTNAYGQLSQVKRVPCPAGTWSSDTAQTSESTCTACGAGKWSSETAQTSESTCKVCSVNTNDDCGGAFAGTCRQNYERQRIGDVTSTCVLINCEPGYGFNTADQACELCDVTQFKYNKDASVADANGGSCAAAACPVGQGWNADISQEIVGNVSGNIYPEFNCVNCVDGTFSSTPDTGQCETWRVCNPGEKVVQTPTTTRDRTCTPCDAGRYQDGTNVLDDCKACSAGKWSSETAQTAESTCTACGAGKWSDQTAQTAESTCTACGAGKWSSETAQTSESTCTACGAGEWSAETAQTSESTCTACGAGKWSAETAQTSESTCTACGAGKWSTETAQTAESTCTACGAGKWSSETAQTSESTCTACSRGRWSSHIGLYTNAQCTACGAGKWSSETAQTFESTCTACGAGKWSSETAQTSESTCTACGTGKKSTQTAATSEDTCASCAEGQYQESTGQTECKACPALTYQNLKTQSSCKPCVEHAENCGGSSPGTCASGYERNALEVPLAEANCINIDECERGTDNCHAQASCTDTEGSFFCTCNPGYLGDGVTCTLPTCEFTDGFVENTHVDGMELIFCTCTTHGLCNKTANTGMYCDSDTGCSEYPTCNEDSTDPNAEECHCGDIMCSEGATTGEYCYAPHDLCTSFKDGRRSSYQDGPGNTVEFIGHLCGEGPTSDDCVCGNTFNRVCYEGLDCTQGVCSEPALCSIGDGSDLIAQPCKCTEHVDCWSQTGRYCFQSHDQCRELPLCKYRDGVTRNLNECMCDTNECLGNEQYCHGDWNHMCSIAGKCEHEDGATKNIVDCWCDVTSPDGNALEPSNVAGAMVLPDNSTVLLCTNEPYCQNQQAGHERCDILPETYPVQTDSGFVYINQCEANVFLNADCFCTGTTACQYGTYCIDHSYCDTHPKCEQRTGEHVEPKDCTCSQGNTCLTNRAPVCGVDGECTIPPCIAAGSGFSIDMPCRCDIPGVLSQECTVNQYCYNPPEDFGTGRGCVETKLQRCFNSEGREINDFGEPCVCGLGTDRVFCKNMQYCNGQFAICSDTPNPSCAISDGSRPNGEGSCLCGTETCAAYDFCDSSHPTRKCHKQYCSDYELSHPELCNRARQFEETVDVNGSPTQILTTVTYANGLVSEDQTCDESNIQGSCTTESFAECCRPCPADKTFKQGLGLCVSQCDYALCTGEYVRAPTIGAPVNVDASLTWTKFYIRTQLNPDWADYCQGESCGPDDVKRCCVPKKQCADEDRFTLCYEDKHSRQLIPNATCNNFACSPDQCCEVVECTCDGGVPRPGISCSKHGQHECAYCNEDHWKDGLFCNPIYQCSEAEYEITTPTPRLRNRVCTNLTVCGVDEYIFKNETIRAPNTNTVVFNVSVAISDRECRSRTQCTDDEYQEFAPNQYQDRVCAKRTQCTNEQYAVILLDGNLALSDAICMNRTICTQTQYIADDGNTTSDRVCSAIRGPCSGDKVETQAPIPGIRNRFCQTPRQCTADEYESQAPTNTSNRECAPIRECTDVEYESQAPTNTSNRQCALFTICTDDEYQSKAPVARTSDRECSALSLCDPAASPPEYETQAPTAFTDRVCTRCADETCRGCMIETDCEFDAEAKVHKEDTCTGNTCARFVVKGTSRNVIFEPPVEVLEYGSHYRFDVVDDLTFFVSGIETQSSALALRHGLSLGQSLESNGIQQGGYVYFFIPLEHEGAIGYRPHEGTNVQFALQRDCVQRTVHVGSKTGQPVCTSVCGEAGAMLTQRTILHDVIGDGEPCLSSWTSTPCLCVPEGECPEDFEGQCVHNDCKCPVDCAYTVNDQFEPCDATCGEQGFKIKKINVITPANYGGTACPAYGAREMCIGAVPENDCDCYGNRLDDCDVCGGMNECLGCDGLYYKDPGFKKPVSDRCGNCLCRNTNNPVCATEEQKQSCVARLKLSHAKKSDRSSVLQTNLPLIVGGSVAAIFIMIVACVCRPNDKEKTRKYTAIASDDIQNQQAFRHRNIIFRF